MVTDNSCVNENESFKNLSDKKLLSNTETEFEIVFLQSLSFNTSENIFAIRKNLIAYRGEILRRINEKTKYELSDNAIYGDFMKILGKIRDYLNFLPYH